MELIGIEIVHAGQVFDGTRDDIVEFLQQNKFKIEGKAGHDEFFARDSKNWFILHFQSMHEIY